MENTVRKLGKTGPSKTYYLTLPGEIIKELKWKKGERKTIRRRGKKIIVEDWEEEYPPLVRSHIP